MNDPEILLQSFNFELLQSTAHYYSINEKVLGIISNVQQGETELFLFMNGFLIPTCRKIYVDYNMTFNLLDHLKARDQIFEMNAFIPTENNIKNLQLLANAKNFINDQNCLQDNYPTQVLYKYSKVFSFDVCSKLKLALQVINENSILILNEPFSGLRKEEIYNMIDLMREVRNLGKIILLTNSKAQNIKDITKIVSYKETGKIISMSCIIIKQ